MTNTDKKAIRRFLHLGESVALQVRERAARWGLKESEVIHQLIHLGLRASTTGAPDDVASDRRHEYVRAMLAQMLSVQIETLLYQRELAADSSAAPVAGNRSQRLKQLDDTVRPHAKTVMKQIRELVEKAAAERAAQTGGGSGAGL